ncbi:hypothetical protein QZM76_29580, partial [Burkholderia multivorans]|nr:hypothetical protein [Burkholderia multivorans]
EVRPEYERNSPRMSSNSYVNLKIATCLVRYADDRLIDQRFPNTANRAAKLKVRVDLKKDSIKRDLIVQGAWQGIKQGAKCAFGEEKKCEEE